MLNVAPMHAAIGNGAMVNVVPMYLCLWWWQPCGDTHL